MKRKKGKRGPAPGHGGRPRKSPQARYAATGTRPRTPREAQVPSEALGAFVRRVARERDSFPSRLIPGETICRNLDGSQFLWSPQHALTRIKSYAEGVVAGSIVSGALAVLAAKRFLGDIESGAARGLFLDPEAARNIETWFADFTLPDFVLQDWELFILGQVFGWKTAAGLRRFREAWLEVAKKNGKTTVEAGTGLFLLLADQEPQAEIYSASNSRDQSKICYRQARRMLEENPKLRHAAKIYHNAFVAGSSFYHPLSADWKCVDGPNVHSVLFDEIHEFSGTVLWEKLTAGTVARRQPLVFSCTTAGERQHGLAWSRHELFTKLLTGVAPDDSKFAFVASIDDGDNWEDESVWPKANTNLGVTVRLEGLREQVAEIRENPAKLTPFLRYHMNTWVTLGASRTLPVDKLNACGGPFDFSARELREWFLENCGQRPAYGGFDLGLKEDVSCFVAFYPNVRFDSMPADQPGYLVAVPWFWLPESRIAEKARLWNVPLGAWVRDGWVTITRGDYVDLKSIKADLKQIISSAGRFRDIGYDAWNCEVMMSELMEEKVAKITRVPQHAGFLTSPAQELIRAVLQERFVHLGNPPFVWMLGNSVLEEDDRGGIVPKKLSQNEKIDAVQALLNAMQRWLNPDEEDRRRYAAPRHIYSLNAQTGEMRDHTAEIMERDAAAKSERGG